MRFRLTLQNPTRNTLMIWNHQYPLMCWLYTKLEAADPDYANFLHQEGYQSNENSKNFKYMTFSPFYFEPKRGQYTVDRKKGIIIHADQFYIDLSFYMPQAAESFIMGIFKNQKMELFNERFKASFDIVQIATLTEPRFSSSMTFTAKAPINVELKTVGKKYGKYLSPHHQEFGEIMAINLSDKYYNATGKRVEIEKIKFELLSDPKKIRSRKINIKEMSTAQTEIKGYYDFDFKLTAPAALIKCGYFGGFGRFNVLGMGMVEVIKTDKVLIHKK